MKRKIFSILILLFFSTTSIGLAQETILPGNEITYPDGNTVSQLLSSQSSQESLIETHQAIEDASNTGFVTAEGTKLYLDGQEYKFSFANNYYLFYKPPYMIDEIFADAQKLGLNAIRTWGFCDGWVKDGISFQPSRGVYAESGFLKMDYILSKASQYDMKLILPLVNNWGDFGGINQYVEWWLGSEPTYTEHDFFFTNETIKTWYTEYVTHFLNRINTITKIAYKDDPTILMWELANEPRAYTDSTGSILTPWINEMAGYIKGIDTNHLVSAGIEGWYRNMQGVNFLDNQSSANIDIATFHLFPDYYSLSDNQALQWITDRVSDAQIELNKPVYIGEFGKMVDRDAADALNQMEARNNLYKNIYNTATSSGANGLGFWILYGDNYPDYDKFGVYYPDDRSTCRVIKSGSRLFVPSSGGKGGGKDKPDNPNKPPKGNNTTSSNYLSGTEQTALEAYRRILLKKFYLEFYYELRPPSKNFE